jgi:hypothetical protein
MDNNTLIIGLFLAFIVYYFFIRDQESFENEDNDMTKNKECSRLSLNKGIYGYRVNMINRGAR